MSRRKYKSYLNDPFIGTRGSEIPRQTRFSIKKRREQNVNDLEPSEVTRLASDLIPTTVSHCDVTNDIIGFDVGSELSTHNVINESSDDEDCQHFSNSCSEYSDDDVSQSDTSQSGSEYNCESDDLINPNISCREGCLLVFAYILKHKLSRDGIQDLLDLIKFFIPNSAEFPGSHYLLKKKLQVRYGSVKHHYYCKICECLIPQNANVCMSCDSTVSTNFFFTFDVAKSLQDIFKLEEVQNDFMKNITKRNQRRQEELAYYEDIYDGDMYKSLGLENHDLTATTNTDGVPCYKSSTFSIWPFLVSLNELSYPLRRKNTFVAALWFGKSKPIFKTFLTPIVDQFNAISQKGITWTFQRNPIKTHVAFPILAADSVARCALQGLNQFNGMYGCPWCLAKGETIWLTETSHKWIYRNHDATQRNKDEFLKDLKILGKRLKQNDTLKSYHGIKLASPLLLLEHFDIVWGFVFDYMHTVNLGVARTLTNLLLDSKYHDKPFYIGNKIQILNTRLKEWRTPRSSERTIRGLDERKHWKSSEWRCWVFISPIILKDILPSQYYLHFVRFVQAVHILCSKRVFVVDLPLAEKLLGDFVLAVENLYGTSFCTFNLHILTHATQCVKNWGPLWNYSLFHFENFNGILLKYFKAASKIEIQISKKIVENSHALTLGTRVFKNMHALQFYEELIHKHRGLVKFHTVSDNCLLLGASKLYALNDDEIKLIKQLDNSRQIISCKSYKRGFVNGLHINTQSGITSKKCACIVRSRSKLYLIRSILLVNSDSTNGCYLVCSKLKSIPIVKAYSAFNVRLENTVKIIAASNIQDCSFYCGVKEGRTIEQIVYIPNSIEQE